MMENLNISPKTTNGGANAAGKLTAEDINLIVAKINEIVGTKVEASDITTALNNSTIILDEDQFEGSGTNSDNIRIKQSFLDSITTSGSFNGQYFDLPDGNNIYRYRSEGGQLVGILLESPAAPTNLIVNDDANTLDFEYVPGIDVISRYEYSINSGNTWAKATVKPIQIGDISKEVGEIRIRVAAGPLNAAGQSASNTTPFISSLPVPAAPTNGYVDDNANTFTWIDNPLYNALSDLEQTLNGEVTITNVTSKPINVGNVNRAVGDVGVRIKAIPGVRNASAWLKNTTPFTNALFVPAKPVSPDVNDVLNTFSWGYVNNFTNFSDYEKTLDGGLTYTPVESRPFSVGNVARGLNQVGVRVKEVPNQNASSPTLFNDKIYTVTEEDTSVPVTSFLSLDNVEVVNSNSVHMIPGNNHGWMKSNLTIAEGVAGSVQMDVVKGYPSMWLILNTGLSNDNFRAQYVVQLSYNSVSGNSQVNGIINENYISSDPLTGVSKVRLRTDGVMVYCEYFTTSWFVVNQAPHNGTLRIKGYFEIINSEVGNRAVEGNNIRHTNFS